MISFLCFFYYLKTQRIRIFKRFLRRKAKRERKKKWKVPKEVLPALCPSLTGNPTAACPLSSGSLLLMWVIGQGVELPGGAEELEWGSCLEGPVTCGEVAPEGVGRFAPVSGVSTSSARVVIKSPISGYWPPASMWTSDYSWNRHNLNPLAGVWPFQLVQWSLPPLLFICWHTDSKLHRSFLLAE